MTSAFKHQIDDASPHSLTVFVYSTALGSDESDHRSIKKDSLKSSRKTALKPIQANAPSDSNLPDSTWENPLGERLHILLYSIFSHLSNSFESFFPIFSRSVYPLPYPYSRLNIYITPGSSC